MSMLAGPRRKQKVINLRAKNNAWSNDKNKFGQRMLEKMGWNEGKGLGAKENGMVEHVVARYKNDEKGLGYVDKNDQWTKHEDDFNALLANLSNGNTDQDQSQETLHSGKSLESKSKKSKARIHYHKFTRGKDLARYSEKDLANIFGKKTLKADENNEPQKEEDDNEKVFTEKGSMYDYFKSKLANVKGASKLFENNNDKEDDVPDHCFQGFSNAVDSEDTNGSEESKGLQGYTPFAFYNIQESETCESTTEEIKKKSKKKKKSKNREEILESVENDIAEEITTTEPCVDDSQENHVLTETRKEKKSKKNKKSKHTEKHSEAIEDNESAEAEPTELSEIDNVSVKKSKKRAIEEPEENNETQKSKKKKKKHKKQMQEEGDCT